MVSSKVAPANEAEESPSKQGGRARARGAGSARGGEARASFKGPKRAPLMLRLEEHERQIEELQKLTAPDVPPKTAAFALANLNKGLSEGYLTTPLHRAARCAAPLPPTPAAARRAAAAFALPRSPSMPQLTPPHPPRVPP